MTPNLTSIFVREISHTLICVTGLESSRNTNQCWRKFPNKNILLKFRVIFKTHESVLLQVFESISKTKVLFLCKDDFKIVIYVKRVNSINISTESY